MDGKVEEMMVLVKNEDVDGIRKAISAGTASLITREVAIVSLMEGVLDADIILPRLVVCGIRTISPFHYAALRGADSVLLFFLSKVPVEQELSNGSTCLHFACFSGVVSTVEMLLDRYYMVDINKADSYGWPALHYASIGGQMTVVEELCRRRINIMHRDKDGTTAAYRAKIFGHYDIVEYFNEISNNNPNLLEPKEHSDEKIYSQGKEGRSLTSDSFDSDLNADRRFIEENNYDTPGDLITKIQCKYSPATEAHDSNNNNNVHHNNNNGITNGTPTDTIMVGENIYDLPSDPKISTSSTDSGKEKSVKKIQALVESQFKDIFLEHEDDPYLQPIGASQSLYSTIGPSSIHNIGFKTLKYLLRSEFQKLKSSYNPGQNPSANNTLLDEHNIYEEITKGTLRENENKWVKGGQTIKVRQTPKPPLPPRTSIIAKPNSDFLFENNKNTRNGFNTDFKQASEKLNLIEETQFVKEACFNELIYVLQPGDWQKLARNLPLRSNKTLVEEKIRKIEKQFPKSIHKQARTALSDWNQYYGKNASLQKLVEALKKSDLVEKIKAVEMASQREFNA